jgi:hypothetical protein
MQAEMPLRRGCGKTPVAGTGCRWQACNGKENAMPDLLILSAALVLLITFFTHVVVGGRYVARPLLADTHLPKASKWLNYYCWHLVSLMLLALPLGLTYAAWHQPAQVTIAGLAVFLLACSGLSAGVAMKGQIPPLRFPSTALFLIAALLLSAAAFDLGNLPETP